MISSIVATAQRSYNARNVALSSQCSRLFRRVPFITQCRQFEIFFSVVEIEPRQASTLLELGGADQCVDGVWEELLRRWESIKFIRLFGANVLR